jgi:hypothetical protein
MPLIDDHGRLFGKVNLIDAVIAFIVLGLIPLGYGAMLLFRTPMPKIVSITPAQVVIQPGGSTKDVTLKVLATNLRPFLRARVGTTEAALLIQSPTVAEIKLPELTAGTYEIALADEGQELLRVPAALTVSIAAPGVTLPTASGKMEVQVVGAFVGAIAREDLDALKANAQFEPAAFAMVVRSPEQATQRVKIAENTFATTPLPGEIRVPAILRVTCSVLNGECKAGDVAPAPNAVLALKLLPSKHVVKFSIDQVFPPGVRAVFPTEATIRVRFVTSPEVVDAMKPGDTDLPGPGAERTAVLTAVGADRQNMTGFTNTEGLNRRSIQVQQPVLGFIGTVRVPIVFTPSGWSYKDRPVKVGAPFTFESISGAMMGWIIEMKVGQE